MTHEVLNLIGGERVAASDGSAFERRNPADVRQVVSTAPESTADDVAAAVAAAVDGLARWRLTTPTQRADVLSRAGRLLAERADDIAA
jgi:alpha-ketoglutaric semialdehyde dehydrogenase